MATWSRDTKHSPESINGGKQYEPKDRVKRDDLNAVVENSIYCIERVDDVKNKSDEVLNFAKVVSDNAKGKAEVQYVDDSIVAAIENTWEAIY